MSYKLDSDRYGYIGKMLDYERKKLDNLRYESQVGKDYLTRMVSDNFKQGLLKKGNDLSDLIKEDKRFKPNFEIYVQKPLIPLDIKNVLSYVNTK